MKPVDCWLSEERLASLYSSNYWNDVNEERSKEFWIADGDYQKCLDYLSQSGLLRAYERAAKHIEPLPAPLKVVDLAAGIGWTSALLSRLDNVVEVHAVEISKHRIGELFEHSSRMLGGDESKLFRHLGSFYDLKFPNESIDVIFLSQAFHHAERPLALLVECDRVLKTGGRLLLIGEHYIGPKQIIRRVLSRIVKQRRIVTDFSKLFPPDPKLGDHFYRRSDYYSMFGWMGYGVRHELLDSETAIYVADKGKAG